MKLRPRALSYLLLLTILSLLLLSCTPELPASSSEAESESISESILPEEEKLQNLYIASASTPGILASTGETTPSEEHVTSAAITVEAGETLYFGPLPTTQSVYLQGYAADGSISAPDIKQQRLREVSRFYSGHKIYAFEIPDNTTAIRLILPKAYSDLFLASTLSFTAYDHALFFKDSDTRDLFVSKNEKYPAYLSEELMNKRVLFLGDSICAAGKETQLPERGWAGRIGIAANMTAVNRSVSGASLSTIRGENRILFQYEKDPDPASYDFVILHGGVNDAWGTGGVSAPVGEVGRSYHIEDFDTTTYAGALEELIATVKKSSPNAEIGYIMNFATPNYQHPPCRDMSAYYAVGKEVCEKWGIPYLNMYDDPILNDMLENDTTNHLYDKLHPGTTGYDILYTPIMYWMESLPHTRKLERFPYDFME